MNNNFKLFNSRYRQIVTVVIILMAILAVRLFVVAVIQHSTWTSEASDQNTKVIYTPAPRGNIYDRNGRIIATNKQIFTVSFNVSAMTTEEINNSCLEVINILEENGDKYTDNFPIKISQNGNFYYTYKKQIEKWLVKQGFSKDLTAEQAFKKLRDKYNIDSSMDRLDAMDVLQDKYNLDPPISAKLMEYTYDMELKSFLIKFGYPESEVDEGISADECFKQLRKNYNIDKELSKEDARKIFIIRNEIATNGFTRYNPITVAKDVSDKTIAVIEELGIKGVEIASEAERYYPNGTTACHIIGYMGAISESESEHYVDELGYSASDLIGKDGVEATYESELHGTPGVRKIRVNSSGEYVETISETEPIKGNDVYLTIDLDLQRTSETALKKAILENPNSQSGATVSIEPSTGEVLALASYPVYDPNIFANGISEKAWESVQRKNPRDNLSPAPLYNNATQLAVAPGSTFKPITAVTALECGLNPNAYIYDRGYIDYGGRKWACSSWNDYGGSHGSENLEWGIGNSCNYYFFCIATGKDWGTGASLGYSKKITVDTILSTAKKFGLGKETGVELNERVAPLASAQQKKDLYYASVWDAVYNKAYLYFPNKILNDYDKLKENIDTIANWIYENPSYGELCSLIEEKTDCKKSQIENLASMVKFDYFQQSEWTTGDQFNISIGQGDNAYTPIQMASYIGTIANGGVKNRTSIISGVENEGITDKGKASVIKLKPTTIPNVVKGMERVCSSGTLSGVFGGFPVTVAGKTGTAENQSIKQPADEVEYIKNHLGSFNSAGGTNVKWSEIKTIMEKLMDEQPESYSSEDETVDDALIKASNYKITQSIINSYKGTYDYYAWTVAFAPAESPKIATSVMLVEGGYSSNAAPVVKTIIADYLNVYGDKSKKTKRTDIDGMNKVQ